MLQVCITHITLIKKTVGCTMLYMYNEHILFIENYLFKGQRGICVHKKNTHAPAPVLLRERLFFVVIQSSPFRHTIRVKLI